MTATTLSALSRRPGAGFGSAVVAALVFVALAAPVVAPYDPNAIRPAERFADPSWLHLLGTDHLGRDLLSRLIFGARIALGVSLTVVLLSLTVGVLLGTAAALRGGIVDRLVVAAFDVISAFPSVILALAVIAVVGPGLVNLVLLVSVVFVPHFGRLARAQAIALGTSPFVEAERVLGVGGWRIALVHVVPNLIGPILVLACMDIPVVITIEAGLSFLGLGIRPPLPSWGVLLNDGYVHLDQSPWPAIGAGGILVLATLGFALLGEAMRDALDPKLRRRP